MRGQAGKRGCGDYDKDMVNLSKREKTSRSKLVGFQLLAPGQRRFLGGEVSYEKNE